MSELCDDDAVCDRCGREARPRRISSGEHVAWCHYCCHECTFTRAEMTAPPKRTQDEKAARRARARAKFAAGELVMIAEFRRKRGL